MLWYVMMFFHELKKRKLKPIMAFILDKQLRSIRFVLTIKTNMTVSYGTVIPCS